MINKGQIMSFVVVLVVILFASKVAISNGDNLQQDKNIPQEAFIAQEVAVENTEQEVIPEIIQQVEATTTKETVSITIDNGQDIKKEFVLELSTTTTVLALLQEACLTANLNLETKEYEFGIIVEAINNQKNGQDNKYWLYYVNNVMPQLTPDKIQVNPNDKIEFRFSLR